jgi:hypothetical protein
MHEKLCDNFLVCVVVGCDFFNDEVLVKNFVKNLNNEIASFFFAVMD